MQQASKRNKNNKKLFFSGDAVGKLQTVRDVFAIIRDFFVIVFFIVLVITLLAIYNFVSNFNPAMLSSITGQGMPEMQGPMPGFDAGRIEQEQVYQADEEIKSILQEFESKAMAQDFVGVQQALTELRTKLEEKGMHQAVNLIDKMEQQAAQNDVEGALESYLRLKKMLGVQ